MRKTSSCFRCLSSLARFAVVCCLGVLLLVPVSLFARSRHSHHPRHRAHARTHVRQVSARSTSARPRYRRYRVRRGDTLSEIASRYGTTTSELRRANHLRSNRIAAGHNLYVPALARAGEEREVARAVPSDRTSDGQYRVRRGDTLSTIASRYHTTVSELRRSNGLRSNRIDVGHVLTVPVPAQNTRYVAAVEQPKVSHAAAPVQASEPAVQSAALKPAVMDVTPNVRGAILRTTSIPSSMPEAPYGTHEVLVHQNIIADVEGLQRIQSVSQLRQMIRDGDLTPLPASSALAVDPRLDPQRRYCRPWTAQFLEDLAEAHERLFGRPLRVTSAVRTASFQRRLSYRNANAAPVSGNTASPHLTGEAIDIGKKGMSRDEIAWMREVLSKLQAAGKLDVEEEFRQACFHISVYKTYNPAYKAPERLIASNAAPSGEELSEEAEENASLKSVKESRSHNVRRERTRRRTRRAVARSHRHHHSSISLLAAGIR